LVVRFWGRDGGVVGDEFLVFFLNSFEIAVWSFDYGVSALIYLSVFFFNYMVCGFARGTGTAYRWATPLADGNCPPRRDKGINGKTAA